MEIRLYLRMLQRGWWIILLTGLIAMNIALIASYLATPIYRATVRFTVSPNPTLTTGSDVITSLQALDKRSIVSTYAEFLDSSRIYNETVSALQLNPVDAAKYTHGTVALPDANVLELSVEGPDPTVATRLANSIGPHAIRYIKDLYNAYDISVLDPASVPVSPISPQPLRDASLALVLGLVLGSALAILRESIRIPLESYRNQRSTDPVSLAYRKSYFDKKLDDAVAHSPKDNISVGLVHLDGLSGLIDSLPQPVSQQLLRQVTSTLRKELRGNDVVGRWNEISFALMLPSTPEVAASRTLNRIGQALDEPIQLENYGETVMLNPAVSVATRRENESVNDLMSRVQRSLEQAIPQR